MGLNIGLGDADTPNRGYELYIASLVMVLVAGLFVLGRLAARWTKRQFGMDDYSIVLSLAFSIVLSITINLAVVNGYGKHKADLTRQEIKAAIKWFYYAQVFYKVVLGLNKVSMLCLYLRIFIAKYFRWLCYASLAVVIGWAIGSVVATIFQCVPIAGFWDKSIEDARCINSDAFWYSYGITNIITDAIIFGLPIREVAMLQLPRREKIGLMLVFLMGAFVCVTSIIRVIAVANSTKNKSDITWHFIHRGVWTLIEANTGIICACLPMLKVPLTIIFPRIFRATSKDQSDRPSKDSHQLDSHPNSNTWVSSDGTIINSVKTSVTAGAPKKSSSKRDVNEEERTPGWHHKHQPQSILRQTEVVVSRQGEVESTSSFKRPASVKEHV